MQFSAIRIAAIAAAFAVFPSAAALADRMPTDGEKASIENALRTQGYTSWEDIERDGDTWEIDNAVDNDGKTYDLTLNASDLSITEKDEE